MFVEKSVVKKIQKMRKNENGKVRNRNKQLHEEENRRSEKSYKMLEKEKGKVLKTI